MGNPSLKIWSQTASDWIGVGAQNVFSTIKIDNNVYFDAEGINDSLQILGGDNISVLPDQTFTSVIITTKGIGDPTTLSTTSKEVVAAINELYGDISGLSIPNKTSNLTNDSGFITSSNAPVTSVNTKTGAVSLTYSDVGAAASSHGNHVPTIAAADNKIFLRNDNTWATITPANIGAMATTHTANSITALGGTSQALGAVSNGSGTVVALSNHIHPTTGLMLTTHTANSITALGGTSQALGSVSNGSGTTVALSNHVHPTTGLMLTTHTANSITGLGGTSQPLGAASNGTGTVVALSDHIHPTNGLMLTTHTANSITALGGAPSALGVASNGSGTAVALSNHVHAIPKLSDLADDSTHRLTTDTEKTAWNSKINSLVTPSTLVTNAQYDGEASIENVADTCNIFDLVYLNSAGYKKASATSEIGFSPCVAMALEAGSGSKKLMKRGYVTNTSWTWTTGQLLYLSTTSAGITSTAPNATGNVVQMIGYAVNATTIYFNPQYVWVTI